MDGRAARSSRNTETLALLGFFAVMIGCSVFNAPDDLAAVTDGGFTDSGMHDADGAIDGDITMDADVPDGGDACVDACREREDCTSTEDDDMDGLVNCADFDCLGESTCCAPTAGAMTQLAYSGPTFERLGAEPALSGGWLADFGASINALRGPCLPTGTGVELEIELRPQLCPTCPEDSYVSIGVTGAQRPQTDGRLFADLAVEVLADNRVQLRQGDEVTPLADTLGNPGVVRIVLTPSFTETERLVASVLLARGDGAQPVVTDVVVVNAASLLEVGECDGNPGLYVAVQGRGGRYEVSPVTVEDQQCANPSHFDRPPGAPFRLDTLGLGLEDDLGADSARRIGAPAVASQIASSQKRWDILLEATNVDPALESSNHVGYSLFKSNSLGELAPLGWSPDNISRNWVAGDEPPSCYGEMSCMHDHVALREPAITYSHNIGALSGVRGVAAGELVTALPNRDRYGIYDIALSSSFSSTLSTEHAADADELAQQLIVAPDDVPFMVEVNDQPEQRECESLRHPALARRGSEGYWLFYTCVSLGAPSEIHVIELDDALRVPTGAPPPRRIVTRELLGSPAYAAAGVEAPEILIEPSGDSSIFRIWFVAFPSGRGVAHVGMVQGVSTDAATLPDKELAPFPGNPVLSDGDAILDPCAGSSCRIESLAVTRMADPVTANYLSNKLLFLVARRVNDPSPAEGERYELVPLEQLWEP